MCHKKCFDAIAICASILIGVAFALLVLFNQLGVLFIVPFLGLALSAGSLLVLVIAAASLLQQNNAYNHCMCHRAHRLLLGALWLLIISMLALIIPPVSMAIIVIFTFLLFALTSYTLFLLYCWLKCLVGIGCGDTPC